jgi:anti-sigma factor RsiW
MTLPSPVSCAEVLRRIQAYLDGELDSIECGAIEHHCESCERCAGIVGGLRKTIGLCRVVGRAPLPRAVSERARRHMKRLLGASATGQCHPGPDE